MAPRRLFSSDSPDTQLYSSEQEVPPPLVLMFSIPWPHIAPIRFGSLCRVTLPLSLSFLSHFLLHSLVSSLLSLPSVTHSENFSRTIAHPGPSLHGEREFSVCVWIIFPCSFDLAALVPSLSLSISLYPSLIVYFHRSDIQLLRYFLTHDPLCVCAAEVAIISPRASLQISPLY